MPKIDYARLEDMFLIIEEIQEYIEGAIGLAEQLSAAARHTGGDCRNLVESQVEAYLIPSLRDWVYSGTQPGSLADLREGLQQLMHAEEDVPIDDGVWENE